jgi:hypothetical protein
MHLPLSLWWRKKVESFIIPLPILEKVTLIADQTKATEAKPVPLQTVVEAQLFQKRQLKCCSYSIRLQTRNNIKWTQSFGSFHYPVLKEESNKAFVKRSSEFSTESFSETEMLVQWTKYAKRLGDKGFKIMSPYLSMIPFWIWHYTRTTEWRLKIRFWKEINGLLGHLKGHLHNHDITIAVIVKWKFRKQKNFNEDRYNRLHEINLALNCSRTFD